MFPGRKTEKIRTEASRLAVSEPLVTTQGTDFPELWVLKRKIELPREVKDGLLFTSVTGCRHRTLQETAVNNNK